MSVPISPKAERELRRPDARPAALAFLRSDLGLRVFSLGPAPALENVLPARWDGAARHEGRIAYGRGTFEALAVQDRVLGFGALAESFGPAEGDLLAALEQRDRGELSVELDNADRFFSRMLQDEELLGGSLHVALGFEGLALADYVFVFGGRVDRVRLSPETLEVRARPGAPELGPPTLGAPVAWTEFVEDYESFYDPGAAPEAGGEFTEGFE